MNTFPGNRTVPPRNHDTRSDVRTGYREMKDTHGTQRLFDVVRACVCVCVCEDGERNTNTLVSHTRRTGDDSISVK